jgi:hypothetical protein
MSSKSLQWFLMANTAHLFGFKTYTYIKIPGLLLKSLPNAGD